PANGDALYYLNKPNADGTINSERTTTNDINLANNVPIGNPNPTWTGGITNNFSFKGIDLAVTLVGVFGNQIFDGAGQYYSVGFNNGPDNQSRDQLNRWQKPGDITNVPKAVYLGGNGIGQSSRFVSSGNYGRLRSVVLGYNLPSELVKKGFLQSARVFVQGFNLLTFTKYQGWDPEVSTDYATGTTNTTNNNISQGTLLGLLTATLLLSGLPGCNNKLNVQPISSIDTANALNTSDDVEAALVGCYTGLQSSTNHGGDWQLMTDLLADNGDEAFVGTFLQPQQAQRKALLTTNSFVSAIWLNSYDVINRANNVLANLSKLNTPALQASVEGQARFLRALMYFDLVRTYARDWQDGTPSANLGVPLVLTPTATVSDANNVPRNTVAEVYTQVINDLTIAETKMATTNGVLANRYAAAAVLARVYLQQANYPAAAAAANRVISSNRFLLNQSYADNFVSTTDLLANTPEDIFAIQISAQSGTNDFNTFYSQNRRADVEVQQQFVNLFNASDGRLAFYQDPAINGGFYTNKYDVLYGNIKLIRLDEMYLIRAEANLRTGTQVGSATPLADVNTIRSRAGLSPLSTVALADVLTERRIELAFEGFRLFDLKRNKESTTDPLGGAAIAWNANRLVFPIPLREMNANPNLVQNPGYQ
nr:hypothetical protein [Tanacetum cinerariifolium]